MFLYKHEFVSLPFILSIVDTVHVILFRSCDKNLNQNAKIVTSAQAAGDRHEGSLTHSLLLRVVAISTSSDLGLCSGREQQIARSLF